MSDRYIAVVVTFTDDVKDEDAKPLIKAIKMLRGVQAVEPVKADISSRMIEESRVRFKVAEDIHKFAYWLQGIGDEP